MRSGQRSPAGWRVVTDQALRHPGLILGIARFFYNPRGSMRGVLDSGPSEGRLFAYALIAAAILLFGRILDLVAGAAPTGGNVMARAAEQTVSLLFFLPIVYYAVAALGTLLARAFGGLGSWREGRAAFFWAALVSAPVIVVCAMAGSVFGPEPTTLFAVIVQVGQIFFAWAVAQCFAETFGFGRTWPVLAVIGAIVLAIFVLLWQARL